MPVDPEMQSRAIELAKEVAALRSQLAAAVEFIGVVRDELVKAGGDAGDRDVALRNLRALKSRALAAEGDRDEALALAEGPSTLKELAASHHERGVRLAAAEGALATAKRDLVLSIIKWLRESERLTLAQGKPRTATTVRDLADALERDLLPALSPAPSAPPEKSEPIIHIRHLCFDAQCKVRWNDPSKLKPSAPAEEADRPHNTSDGLCDKDSRFIRPIKEALADKGVPTGADNWPIRGAAEIVELAGYQDLVLLMLAKDIRRISQDDLAEWFKRADYHREISRKRRRDIDAKAPAGECECKEGQS